MIIIIQVERLQLIVDLVMSKEVVTIEELCEAFGVSKATMRRDLKELEGYNKLMRTHGGAMTVARGTSFEPSFNMKKGSCIDEKKKIAQAALNLIKPGDTIILDAGTTTLELARKMYAVKNITVLTNDLYIAFELAQNTDINLIVMGGLLRKGVYTLFGHFTEMMAGEIHVDKVFLGADAINPDYGVMNSNFDEIQVKKLMIQAAKEKVILCDHTKFDSVALANVCSLMVIDRIITGRETRPEIVEFLKEAGINIETV